MVDIKPLPGRVIVRPFRRAAVTFDNGVVGYELPSGIIVSNPNRAQRDTVVPGEVVGTWNQRWHGTIWYNKFAAEEIDDDLVLVTDNDIVFQEEDGVTILCGDRVAIAPLPRLSERTAGGICLTESYRGMMNAGFDPNRGTIVQYNVGKVLILGEQFSGDASLVFQQWVLFQYRRALYVAIDDVEHVVIPFSYTNVPAVFPEELVRQEYATDAIDRINALM